MIQHSLLQGLSSKTPRIAEGEQGVKPAAAPANGHAHGEEAQGFAAVMLAQKDMAKGMGSKLPVLPESGKDRRRAQRVTSAVTVKPAMSCMEAIMAPFDRKWP